MKKKFRILLVVTLVAAALVASQPNTQAHVQGTYFADYWPNGSVQTIAVGDVSAMYDSPSASTIRARADWAGQRWDNISSAPNWGYFTNSGIHDPTVKWYTWPCTNVGAIAAADVWITSLSEAQMGSNSNGEALRCATGGVAYRVRIRVRNNPEGVEVWHYDATKPPGDPYADVWQSFVATLAHEMGHAAAFGSGSQDHFIAGTSICDNTPYDSSDQTMCGDGYDENHHGWFQVTLGLHDQHTFRYAYD